MAIGKISGQMLFDNLDRSGVDLSLDTNLAYFDVTNRRIGINKTSPAYTLDVNGNAHIGNLYVLGNTITSETGKVNLGSISNVVVTGGTANYVLYTDGNGNLNFGNLNMLSGLETFTANNITLGSNVQPAFVSNAVTLTTNTTVTDALAELNYVLGKLVPPPPPNFPGANTLVLSSSTSSALMCNFTQTDNSPWGNLSVAGGTSVSAVRSTSYTTSGSTITDVGPGTTGTITAYLNGTPSGNVVLTGTNSNTTNGNVYVYNVRDYNAAKSSITAGFWSVFSAYALGTAQAGWNTVWVGDSQTGTNTNAVRWYVDTSAPGTPTFSGTNIVLSSNVVAYSSTVPHFTSSAGFTLTGNVNKLSGDMYPNSSTLLTGSSGGAFQTPASVSYATAGVTTPLARNLYVSSGNVSFTTTSNITTSGFGSSSTGPSVSVNNSYSTGSATFSPGVTVLYKNGTSTNIEETSIPVGSVGTGSGNGFRIINPDFGTSANNTPAYTQTVTAFNSQTGTFYASDATVVAAVLKWDQTNYSSSYLPVGPNLSSQNASQYFTFKFVRSSLSKFNISYAGTCAGMWIALPGSTIDSTSSLNGWLDCTQSYSSGIPGANNPGNGSNGCNVGGFSLSGGSFTVSFGTISSSSTSTNEVFVRIKLTSGQSISALSIVAATN
jgi:hypothetical protein